jgi:cyclic nucleotide-binding protein
MFHQGDPGDAFYILIQGSVKVSVSSPDGDEMVLATLRPPDALGEVALLDLGERSASAACHAQHRFRRPETSCGSVTSRHAPRFHAMSGSKTGSNSGLLSQDGSGAASLSRRVACNEESCRRRRE